MAVLLPWRAWKLRTMDLISNSTHGLQNMPISKSCLWPGRTPRHWPLADGSHTGFHQWLLGKYRWLSNRVRGFPVLVFLRPFRPVIPREPEHSIMYSLHITLVTPALQSQLVLRARLQGQPWLHVAKRQRLTGFPALLPAALPWLKPTMRPRPGQPEAEAGFTQSLPMTSQASSRALFRLYNAQRLTAFPALLPGALPWLKPTMRPRLGQPEAEASVVHKAQRPMELSYVQPSASTAARPEQRHETSGLFAPPIGYQSMPTPSQGPGIDMNRLTEQVYQALERKIRLEKQRRGYR
jgi:hypothetical protein